MTNFVPEHWALNIRTTEPLFDRFKVADCYDAILRFFSVDRLPGEYGVSGNRRARKVGDVRQLLLDMPTFKGEFTVSFRRPGVFNGGIKCIQLPRPKRAVDLASAADYRTHDIELCFENPKDSLANASLFDFVCNLSLLSSATFAGLDRNDGVFASFWIGRNLWAGVPAIYPITVFGPPFVKNIGVKKLASLNWARQAQLSNGTLVVQIPKTLDEAKPHLQEPTIREIKELIGPQYFSDIVPQRSGNSGRVGFLTFLAQAISDNREMNRKERFAIDRPEIDWSGVFESIRPNTTDSASASRT